MIVTERVHLQYDWKGDNTRVSLVQIQNWAEIGRYGWEYIISTVVDELTRRALRARRQLVEQHVRLRRHHVARRDRRHPANIAQ